MLICVILIIWLSQDDFLLIDLAIEHENRVMTHRRAFNSGDDQFLHTRSIRSDNLRIIIVDSLDMDALLPTSRKEMTIVRDVIGDFHVVTKETYHFGCRVCLSKFKYKSKF